MMAAAMASPSRIQPSSGCIATHCTMREAVMSRASLALLMATALCAQDKPPAEVDQALRGRIAKFYQAHVDGKFRQADELVADDTKDYFYEAKKTRFLSYEIQRIEYSENFTRALAIVLCEMRVMFPGFEG